MNRINYLMNGLAALAFIVLFSQCAGKADNQVATTPASANAELSGMKIAYVEIDTLLAKYNFCIDLNEAGKEERKCSHDAEPEDDSFEQRKTGIPKEI